jgi:phage tail protein X
MAKTIRTSEGDRLDSLCARHYGRLNGTVEAVLRANPGLAAMLQPFSAGVLLTLPDLPQRVEKTVQLWS